MNSKDDGRDSCFSSKLLFSSENCDWWMAKHVATGQIGYIPSNYVTKDDNNPESQEYVHHMQIILLVVFLLISSVIFFYKKNETLASIFMQLFTSNNSLAHGSLQRWCSV